MASKPEIPPLARSGEEPLAPGREVPWPRGFRGIGHTIQEDTND